MQLSEYSTAPKVDVYKLFFEDDIPRRENSKDIIKIVKYIPKPVLEQIDNNIDSIKGLEKQKNDLVLLTLNLKYIRSIQEKDILIKIIAKPFKILKVPNQNI